VPGRALAVLSLACCALLAVATVVFLVRNGLYVVLGIAGFMLAVGGGWWTITERMPRRAVGIAGVLAGVGIMVVALFSAGGDRGSTFVRTVVAVGLLVLSLVAARAALSDSLRGVVSRATHRATPPRHPVLLCNPRSGGGKVEKFGLIELASSLGIETVTLGPGLDLAELARSAIDRGADCLGMAGGDGSQALVASIAVEHDVPFVCVSAGTRNHFALDLGLDRDDPRQGLYAYRDAVERHVDYATVNGRFFVNNVSLGVYATIVQQEGYREAKADTSTRLLPELLGKTTEPFDLQFTSSDGREVDGAFLIMVSNNPYVLGASLDASQRRRIDSGQLGVFAVTARTGAHAAEVVTLALGHRSARSSHAFEFTAQTFEVRSKSTKAFAGIDGESLELETPLEFRIHPRGLRVLVPEGNIKVMIRRQARDVRIGDLLSIARGSSPRA
jgi:diacylglycerol kinase family enzyme